MADFECRNKAMALAALEAIANSLGGVEKTALLAVREWVLRNSLKIPEPYEERKRLCAELMENRRSLMTEEERIGEARFFLDGLPYTLEVK
jgi:hypothetical protein